MSNKKIFVAGHNGMVGSSIIRELKNQNLNFVVAEKKYLNLLNQKNVENWFKLNKPEIVIMAAAKVGGIFANKSYPVQFLLDNLKMQTNIIENCFNFNVKKLLFLGSSCIYPKNSPQPIKEEYLLSSELEETNEAYAIAKIAGLKLCQAYKKQYNKNFISLMPTNLYGPNDNFHPINSHVPAALFRKFHEAKINKNKFVEVWGSGKPMRDFLYVDDLAKACVFLLKNDISHDYLNIGSGSEISISSFSKLIKKVVGYSGEIIFDKTMPDGTMRKKLDISIIKKLGWYPVFDLERGLQTTYKWIIKNRIFG